MRRKFNPQRIAFFGIVLAVIVAGVYVFSDQDAITPPAPNNEGQQSTFSDDTLSLEFSYSEEYALEKREIEVDGALATYLTLIPSTYVAPQGGEGPPALTVAVYPNRSGKPLADWLASMTNTAPSPTGGWDFQEATVDGKAALAYTSTGLYESDNVAVAANGMIYIFSASWMTREDETLSALETILRSVDLD